MVDPFRQAEAQYRQLYNELSAGRLSTEQFRQQLSQIRVVDGQGQTWMLQEGTGNWFVWQNGQWVQKMPYPAATYAGPAPMGQGVNMAANSGYAGTPNYGASSGAPAYGQTMQQQVNYGASSGAPAYGQTMQQQAGYATSLPAPAGSWGQVFSKTLLTAIGAVVLFEIIGVLIGTFSDDADVAQMLPIMLAPAALSTILTFFSLSSQWCGRIVSFVVKREQDSSYDDDTVTYHNVTYARLQLDNGRTKDIRPMRDWQVGNVIQKVRGETHAKKVG